MTGAKNNPWICTVSSLSCCWKRVDWTNCPETSLSQTSVLRWCHWRRTMMLHHHGSSHTCRHRASLKTEQVCILWNQCFPIRTVVRKRCTKCTLWRRDYCSVRHSDALNFIHACHRWRRTESVLLHCIWSMIADWADDKKRADFLAETPLFIICAQAYS